MATLLCGLSVPNQNQLHRSAFFKSIARRRPLFGGPHATRCTLASPVEFPNGRPIMPMHPGQNLTGLLGSRDPQTMVQQDWRHDTRLRIFSGTVNPVLAHEIACYMGLDLGKIKIKRFADGEIYVQLQESVRGCDVFLVQPTSPPANENLMELLIMIDACRRASAKNITAVIPYFGYARADRKLYFQFWSCNLLCIFIGFIGFSTNTLTRA